MKVILYLVVLAALAYGVMYAYNNDIMGSVGRTADNTANFATDSAVKNFDANATNTAK